MIIYQYINNKIWKKEQGLSCAKLNTAWASYLIAITNAENADYIKLCMFDYMKLGSELSLVGGGGWLDIVKIMAN